MAQDIRDLFEQERKRSQPGLLEGHENRFLQKLEKHLPQEEKRRVIPFWLRLVAASLLFITIGWSGFYAFQKSQSISVIDPLLEGAKTGENQSITLSDISPDLEKVETYFISSINVGLANLEISEEEQEVVDAYLAKIQELGKEYDNLNKELNTIGVNDMTITALIENLKMRLQLLQRLKKNLNHSKKVNHAKKIESSI